MRILKKFSDEKLKKLLDKVTNKELIKFQKRHMNLRDNIIMAEIDGSTFAKRNDIYEKALGISTKGYTVRIKRDVDEMYTNNYNGEWIKAWNANMDLQPCFDYLLVVMFCSSSNICVFGNTNGVEIQHTQDRWCHLL